MSKSVIYLDKKVVNKNRHPLANESYYLVHLVDVNGVSVPALFTDNDLIRGQERAAKNPEDTQVDFEPNVSWFKRLLKAIGICE